jgi:glycolate oxidase
MALAKEIIHALEDIVGTRNATDDPSVLATYQFPLNVTAIHLGPYSTLTPRGGAVVLPGCTEEVQAIVKLCNKYKIKYKSSSTFWSAMGFPAHEDVIQLDMRRMDRIVEIDQKNMYAVVEPHVIAANLQAEVMKLGLNTHMSGAGASCSLLASATSFSGPGPDTLFMGISGENMLGMEWVMPNGDLMRAGSPGAGLGWFCGEGPGPGIRSIVKGGNGARGSMGVFTKCALKLYPWPGPSSLPITGTIPAYQAKLPDNFRVYTLAFPSWQAWADSVHKIWNAGIGYIGHRQFNMFGRDIKYAMIKILTDPDKNLSDLEKIAHDPEVQKVNEEMKRDYQFILAGMTPGDIEWQEKALDEILVETGGWKVEAMNDPDIANWAAAYLIRLGHKNLNMVYTGAFEGCFGFFGPPDVGSSKVEEATAFKKEWEKKGALVAAGGDSMMGGLGGLGGGAFIMWENFTCWDPHDESSVKGAFDFFDNVSRFSSEKKWGVGMERSLALCRGPDGKEFPKDKREQIMAGSPMAFVFRYQQKIREAFNPNDLGDAYYTTLAKTD